MTWHGTLILSLLWPGLHKLWYPGIRDTSTWSKFGAEWIWISDRWCSEAIHKRLDARKSAKMVFRSNVCEKVAQGRVMRSEFSTFHWIEHWGEPACCNLIASKLTRGTRSSEWTGVSTNDELESRMRPSFSALKRFCRHHLMMGTRAVRDASTHSKVLTFQLCSVSNDSDHTRAA